MSHTVTCGQLQLLSWIQDTKCQGHTGVTTVHDLRDLRLAFQQDYPIGFTGYARVGFTAPTSRALSSMRDGWCEHFVSERFIVFADCLIFLSDVRAFGLFAEFQLFDTVKGVIWMNSYLYRLNCDLKLWIPNDSSEEFSHLVSVRRHCPRNMDGNRCI